MDEALIRNPTLPHPVNFDPDTWPKDALVWLHKASIGRSEIDKLGCYYHEPSGRVVIPVFDEGRLVYWQARAVDGRQPKYINPEVNRQRLVAKYGAGSPLVLTEDVLSAYRVSAVCEAWSLMGTKLTDYVAADILKRGDDVLVWLDPDWHYPQGKRPGIIAAKKIAKQLISMGVNAVRVVSRADPKILSTREIQWYVSHHQKTRATQNFGSFS